MSELDMAARLRPEARPCSSGIAGGPIGPSVGIPLRGTPSGTPGRAKGSRGVVTQTPDLLSLLGRTRRRVVRRFRQVGPLPYLLGLWVRCHFQRAGFITIGGGWPLPSVDNRGGRIEVENCGLFSGVRLECWRGALIKIGSGTYLNRNAEVVAARSVIIGRDCMIARDVIIMDTDQHPLPGRPLEARPVEIGDRVWVGARATILKGVTIGHDSVIGAGAIVTKSVPAGSVVVGPAARVIKTIGTGPV
jgi:acetyltransferase-like isoleucine patch superfamily enzyme